MRAAGPNRRAMAPPMSPDPPVTKATLPASFIELLLNVCLNVLLGLKRSGKLPQRCAVRKALQGRLPFPTRGSNPCSA